MIKDIFKIFILIILTGCRASTASVEGCVDIECNSSSTIAPIDNISDNNHVTVPSNSIPTTNGGVVLWESVFEIKKEGNYQILGGVNFQGGRLLLLYENLGSQIYKLRTRFLLDNGQLSAPNCDILWYSNFYLNFIKINGFNFYIFKGYNNLSFDKYSLLECTKDETLNFPFSFDEWRDIDYLITDNKFYFYVPYQPFKVVSRSTNLVDASFYDITKGDGRLFWKNQSISEDSLFLWISDQNYFWRMNKNTYKFDWFELPKNNCINASSPNWVDNGKLYVVCNSNVSNPMVYVFDVTKF
jgi:hypothetical protein